MNVTERFRCHSLASGQVRCQRFASGRLDVFWIFRSCVVRLDVGIIKLRNRLTNMSEMCLYVY